MDTILPRKNFLGSNFTTDDWKLLDVALKNIDEQIDPLSDAVLDDIKHGCLRLYHAGEWCYTRLCEEDVGPLFN